jgi:hypothetical protein
MLNGRRLAIADDQPTWDRLFLLRIPELREGAPAQLASPNRPDQLIVSAIGFRDRSQRQYQSTSRN